MNIYQKAKNLRKNATMADKVMWKHLSNRQLNGLKFRRQAVVEKLYIADFYCASKKFIIEINGSIHDKIEIKEHDDFRRLNLVAAGYTIIRFSNEDILLQINEILNIIRREIEGILAPLPDSNTNHRLDNNRPSFFVGDK